MGVYTTPAQLAMAQRVRFLAAAANMVKVHEILAKSSEEDFVELTSGTITTRELRRMGHPFARSSSVAGASRGIVKGDVKKWRLSSGVKGQITARGMVNRLPINVQTGRLRSSITLSGPTGGQREYRLFAAAPHARYVLSPKGTRRMVPRGLLGPDGVLRKRHKARVQTAIDVVRKTLRTP